MNRRTITKPDGTVAVYEKKSRPEWQAATWWLERKYPDDWARVDRIQQTSPHRPLFDANFIVIEDRVGRRIVESLKMNSGGVMIPRLERRLARLEAKVRPPALRAVIQAYVDPSPSADSRYASAPFPAEDPSLQQGVNEDGEADISPWWSVTFFEGTQEQQNKRLRELRQDPRFRVRFNDGDGEIPVYFEGGARCDDMYARIHEKEAQAKT